LVTTNFALGNRLLQQIISKCLNGFKQLIWQWNNWPWFPMNALPQFCRCMARVLYFWRKCILIIERDSWILIQPSQVKLRRFVSVITAGLFSMQTVAALKVCNIPHPIRVKAVDSPLFTSPPTATPRIAPFLHGWNIQCEPVLCWTKWELTSVEKVQRTNMKTVASH
jgi:hypothetical protein